MNQKENACFRNTMHQIQKPVNQIQIEIESSTGACTSTRTRLVTVEFAKNMEHGDETNEAETHHENHRRRNLQTRCIVSVESQHVVPSAGASCGRGGAGSVSTCWAATTHTGCSGSGAAWCHDTWSCRGTGRCRLR